MGIDGIHPLLAYLAPDRRVALLGGPPVPEWATGAAVFADLAGFTPLAEALAATWGAQHGAEELTRILNTLYNALIDPVEQYGGSVISFAGDAMVCWFADAPAHPGALRAAAAALAMQAAMQTEASQPDSVPGRPLALRVGIASGRTRRLQVGDPARGLWDVLAGAIMQRMAAAEQAAAPGQIVVDHPTATVCASQGGHLRAHPNPDVAILSGWSAPVVSQPWPAAPAIVPVAAVQPWLLPPIFARLTGGQGEFLAELRPVVALFTAFPTLDYDTDPHAGQQLDAYIRWVQKVLAEEGGTLLGISLGDKGSSWHAVFGAPAAQPDDPARAVQAAARLLTPPARLALAGSVRIGLNQGQVWVGAYGSTRRRTYDIHGDAVNLAARLMQAAAPGTILATRHTGQAAGPGVVWDEYPPLTVKGKTAPVAVLRLNSFAPRSTLALHEPRYRLPLVGRAAELAVVERVLAAGRAGAGQLLGIQGEAGIGKSRLVAEMIARASASGWQVYGGAALATGTTTPYLAWIPIWRAFFGVDETVPAEAIPARLTATLEALDPALLPRSPLIGPLLGVNLPDNDLTASVEGTLRQDLAHGALVDCLRLRAGQQPILLVLEDTHWLDPLGRDLLNVIGRAIGAGPLVVVLAYRESTAGDPFQRIRTIPYWTELVLTELAPAEGAAVIRQLLADQPISPAVLDQLTARAGGNPFYLEELVRYLAGQGTAIDNPAALTAAALPDSLHSLILHRIDQLSERQKMVVKVASVIGRAFPVDWLWGVYPAIGPRPAVHADLEVLDHMGLTPLDTPAPDISYLFKHQLIQEVAYGSLPYEQRAQLHDHLAGWLEAAESAPLEVLVYHYGRGSNRAKQREYFARAAAEAAGHYAAATALAHYERLLPLLAAAEQPPVWLAVGQMHELIGQWDQAQVAYEEAGHRAAQEDQPRAAAQSAHHQGTLAGKRGAFAQGLAHLETARAAFTALDAPADLGQCLVDLGNIHQLCGAYDAAETATRAGLTLLEQAAATAPVAGAWNRLGVICYYRADYATAQTHFATALEMYQTLNDSLGIAQVLQSLGNVAYAQGDFGPAQARYQESLALRRAIGDKAGIARLVNNLGLLTKNQGDLVQARAWLEEAGQLETELGSRAGQASVANNLGLIYSILGDTAQAEALFRQSLALKQEIGDRPGMVNSLHNLGTELLKQGATTEARRLHEEALALRREMGDNHGLWGSLHHLGTMTLRQGDLPAATAYWREGLLLIQAHGLKRAAVGGLTGLADVAAAQARAAADWMHVAHLLGAVDRLRSEVGVVLEPPEQEFYDHADAAANAALGANNAAAARALGTTWGWEAAVENALAALPPL